MDIALEQAELVAKKAISEELGTDICQSCGCNPKWSMKYPALEQHNSRLSKDLKSNMAELAWLKYQNGEVVKKKNAEDYWLRTKVSKQRQALARMYIEVQHLKAELRKKGSEVQCDTTISSENSEQAGT